MSASKVISTSDLSVLYAILINTQVLAILWMPFTGYNKHSVTTGLTQVSHRTSCPTVRDELLNSIIIIIIIIIIQFFIHNNNKYIKR
jgi:hypothetical protein